MQGKPATKAASLSVARRVFMWRRALFLLLFALFGTILVMYAFRTSVESGNTDSFRDDVRLPQMLRRLDFHRHVTFAIVNYPPRVEYIMSGTMTADEFGECCKVMEIQPNVGSEEFMQEIDSSIKQAGLKEADFVFHCSSSHTDYVGETPHLGYAWLCYCPAEGRFTLKLERARGALQ